MNWFFPRALFVVVCVLVFLNANAFAQQVSPPIVTYSNTAPQYMMPPSVTYEERVAPLVCTVTRMFGMPDTVTINIAADVDIDDVTNDILKKCVDGVKKKIPEVTNFTPSNRNIVPNSGKTIIHRNYDDIEI